MKDNLTEIVFILDRSGSMVGLVNDTIGGYNTFLEKQKQEEGEAYITTVLFDNKYEVLHDRVSIKDVNPLTNKDYYARGGTALFDAIGTTINNIGKTLSDIDEGNRPSKVIFVITTDGYENSSMEFKRSQIKDMITHQQEKYNWQFMFLGANIDAEREAESIGIKGEFASKYTASSMGTDSLYRSVSNNVTSLRSTGEILSNWKDGVK
jgi:uncharacterized protein YegL